MVFGHLRKKSRAADFWYWKFRIVKIVWSCIIYIYLLVPYCSSLFEFLGNDIDNLIQFVGPSVGWLPCPPFTSSSTAAQNNLFKNVKGISIALECFESFFNKHGVQWNMDVLSSCPTMVVIKSSKTSRPFYLEAHGFCLRPLGVFILEKIKALGTRPTICDSPTPESQ